MNTSFAIQAETAEASFEDDLGYLASLTEAAVEASRVRPGEKIQDQPANTLGFTLIRPGGRDCYPAVWTQDFSMTLATGFVSDEEALNHLRVIARAQNGEWELYMSSGATVPPFAIPDHVSFDGQPIYFPGTYSTGEDQGGEYWGFRPPANNHYDFIAIAHHLRSRFGSSDFLREQLGDRSLWERLQRAFDVPEFDPDTGLVWTTGSRRAVGFIFCDSIYMTGKLLFASLLRRRAALQMADFADDFGESPAYWQKEAKRIQRHLAINFRCSSRLGGWLMAATQVGGQPDVWGTIYALYQNALSPDEAEPAMQEILGALKSGTILHLGSIRHVPTNYDARPDSAWERTPTPHNRYQNGAFWPTPTGWLVAILWRQHRELAIQIFHEMVVAMRAEDFRQGPEYGAPWECVGRTPDIAQNAVFLASVALPYGILKNFKSNAP